MEDITETLHGAVINDGPVVENASVEEKHENDHHLTDNKNSEGGWFDESDSLNHRDHVDYEGQKRFDESNRGNVRGRGRGILKMFDNKNELFDDGYNTNHRGSFTPGSRGRGRGFIKKYFDESESFEDGHNSRYINRRGNSTTPGYYGRDQDGFRRANDKNESFEGGDNFNNNESNFSSSHQSRRQNHSVKGGRFNDNFNNRMYGNSKDGHNKRENDKPAGPKIEYIPPDIESEESIGGIKAGLNFDKYDTIEVKVSGADPPKHFTSFHESGLREILMENLSANNFNIPTPVQSYSIPIIMAGRDLMASAQTGSGKTAAYVLPILNYLLNHPSPLNFDENHCEPDVIIMAPTRELAIQISECVWKFSKGTSIKNRLLYGGTSMHHQQLKLQSGVHILTATPGRLMDFVRRNIVTFSSVKFFILDEADRMLDMGFKSDIDNVLKHSTMTPSNTRQTVMFSATFPSEIQHMATDYLKPDYLFVAVGEIGGACKDVIQILKEVKKFDKKKALLNLLKEMENYDGTIVFVEQKRNADYIAAYLCEQDYPTTSIHGDREQPERELAIKDFKTKRMKILVATAVAARGLDIHGVNNVINFDLPKTIDEYVHRIGRTGRLGNSGKAISFFDPDFDSPLAPELVRILKQADQEVPQWLINNVNEQVEPALPKNDFDDIRLNVPYEEEEW